jgi:hypothetical protein
MIPTREPTAPARRTQSISLHPAYVRGYWWPALQGADGRQVAGEQGHPRVRGIEGLLVEGGVIPLEKLSGLMDEIEQLTAILVTCVKNAKQY